jgi:hypothetical protein
LIGLPARERLSPAFLAIILPFEPKRLNDADQGDGRARPTRVAATFAARPRPDKMTVVKDFKKRPVRGVLDQALRRRVT